MDSELACQAAESVWAGLWGPASIFCTSTTRISTHPRTAYELADAPCSFTAALTLFNIIIALFVALAHPLLVLANVVDHGGQRFPPPKKWPEPHPLQLIISLLTSSAAHQTMPQPRADEAVRHRISSAGGKPEDALALL